VTEPLMRAERVEKIYRTDTVETHAVNQISFEVAAGEYLVLQGPSGCGKSSLLAMLGLMEPLSGGALYLRGRDTAAMTDFERARERGLHLGFVFQAFNLIPHLSVRENIQLPLTYHRQLSAAERRELVEVAANDVAIGHRLEHFPYQLSGGQQQRVAIARALVGKPALVLADEPTGNLDSDNGSQVMRLLERLHAGGAAVCLVTHDEKYQSVGERTLHMLDGRIVDDVRR
jgi:putative ABC transport system ATP-binding protein